MKFLPAQWLGDAFDYARYIRAGLSKAEAKQHVRRLKEQRVFISEDGEITAAVTEIGDGCLHISFRNRERTAIRDWRTMQEIKNALAGPEREACELFPAESRLVDSANQYHLWVLPEGQRFPFGWTERLVLGPDDHPVPGAVQRPFEESAS